MSRSRYFVSTRDATRRSFTRAPAIGLVRDRVGPRASLVFTLPRALGDARRAVSLGRSGASRARAMSRVDAPTAARCALGSLPPARASFPDRDRDHPRRRFPTHVSPSCSSPPLPRLPRAPQPRRALARVPRDRPQEPRGREARAIRARRPPGPAGLSRDERHRRRVLAGAFSRGEIQIPVARAHRPLRRPRHGARTRDVGSIAPVIAARVVRHPLRPRGGPARVTPRPRRVVLARRHPPARLCVSLRARRRGRRRGVDDRRLPTVARRSRLAADRLGARVVPVRARLQPHPRDEPLGPSAGRVGRAGEARRRRRVPRRPPRRRRRRRRRGDALDRGVHPNEKPVRTLRRLLLARTPPPAAGPDVRGIRARVALVRGARRAGLRRARAAA